MKIVVGSIQQEVNTFSPIKPTKEDFFYLHGEDMIDQIAVTPLFRENGVEIIPTVYGNAVPSGRMTAKDYDAFCRELVDMIPDDNDFDGIWLYCHGAMDVDEIGSAEPYLLKMIRDKVGYEKPISVALDFHANLDYKIFDYANVVCGYRTAPHADMPGTQIRAGEALLRCIKEKLLPKTVAIRVPLIISGDMCITANYPMNQIMPEAIKAEENPELMAVNVFHGQNWADVPNAGASVTATVAHPENVELALDTCKRIANKYWSLRGEFKFEIKALNPNEAIKAAVESANAKTSPAPVFISDSGDNTTAGAAGDRADMFNIFNESTDLFATMKKRALLGGVCDKPTVDKLWNMNVGESANVTIGGTFDKNSPKINIDVTVLHKSNILNWDGDGADAGRAVVVSCGHFDAIITENRCALISPEIFASVGIDINDYNIICVKLGYLYPKLAEVAADAIIALTKGNSTVVLDTLEFDNLDKNNFYPFNKELVFNA